MTTTTVTAGDEFPVVGDLYLTVPVPVTRHAVVDSWYVTKTIYATHTYTTREVVYLRHPIQRLESTIVASSEGDQPKDSKFVELRSALGIK